MKVNHNITSKERRRIRVRKKSRGTADRPRVTVFRSNKHVFVQVINDDAGKTIVSANDKQKSFAKEVKSKTKTEVAEIIAKHIAEALSKAKVDRVVFDRGHYRYHGRVKMIAEVLRQNGIQL